MGWYSTQLGLSIIISFTLFPFTCVLENTCAWVSHFLWPCRMELVLFAFSLPNSCLYSSCILLSYLRNFMEHLLGTKNHFLYCLFYGITYFIIISILHDLTWKCVETFIISNLLCHYCYVNFQCCLLIGHLCLLICWFENASKSKLILFIIALTHWFIKNNILICIQILLL